MTSQSMPAQPETPLTRYFGRIRPISTEATSLHREWTQKLAHLVASLEADGLEQVLDRAEHAGLFFDLSFARCHRDMVEVQPPAPAERYHDLWLCWLDHMMRASQALCEAAGQRDRGLLGRCRAILTDARSILQDLSAEAEELERVLVAERQGTRFAA